ncbi:MAG TPA: DoxX family membrane protein [Candidatus Paceibacterota bacterium]|nr:DoxX family membrane protein [Candidatus Paceibacterota bacterium]
MNSKQYIGISILRISLSFVFLWFGFSQMSDAAQWIGFVPDWATSIMSAGMLVYLNGIFEIIAGLMLAIGIVPRYVALLLGIHLLIISSSLGFSAVGIRDIGLALATLSLFFLGNDKLALSYREISNE